MNTRKKLMINIVIISLLTFIVFAIAFDVVTYIVQIQEYNLEQQAWLQVARADVLTKDIVVITYNPTRDNTQFLNDLQVILPRMQETQNGFVNGDSSLNMPTNPSDEVLQAVMESQANYLSIVSAAKAVEAQPKSAINAIEVNIALTNTPLYASQMSDLATLYHQESDSSALHLFFIRVGLRMISSIVIVISYLYMRQQFVTPLLHE